MGAQRGDIVNRKLSALVLSTLLFLSPYPALCDHCAENRLVPGDPEHVLANIDVSHSKIDSVLKRYGPPTKHSDFTDPSYPAGSGEGEYTWELGDTDLTVDTMFYTDGLGARSESVTIGTISLAPRHPASGLQTARGTVLCATPAMVRRLYGGRYMRETVNSHPTIKYCFRDDTFLYFRLDAQGKIDEITLEISVE